jgi:predicted  nucleic acid-binding Zn-ribbon protein
MALFSNGNSSLIAPNTVGFEHAYSKVLRDMKHLSDSESIRLLRVDRLVLEADNDQLRMRIENIDKEMVKVTGIAGKKQQQFTDACNEVSHLQSMLQAKTQEIEDLRKAVASLKGHPLESENILLEKLALKKELSRLSLEVQRLKSQNASCQTILSEKLALERQLTSLEIQLETEKRASERFQDNYVAQRENEMKLNLQLEELQGRINQEISERQRLERSNREKTAQLENWRSIYEEKLESLEEILRSTKNQLVEAQYELQQRYAMISKDKISDANRSTKPFDSGITIATPGAINGPKIIRRPSTLLGHKSTFSITPLLGRSQTAPESPESSISDLEHHARDNNKPQNALKTEPEKPKNRRLKQMPHNDLVAVDLPCNIKDRENLSRLDSFDGTLSDLKEGNILEENDSRDLDVSIDSSSVLDRPKPKKRKLLGISQDRTLISEEGQNIEGRKQMRRLGLGRNLTSHDLLPDPAHRSAGQFSPLKRQRGNI